MRTRPVWVEISRHKLTANYLELCDLAREAVSPAPVVLAVVKANAYGHGMFDCARILTGAGAKWLGVTSVEEATRARAACPEAEILVMSGIWRGEAEAVIEHRLIPIVWEPLHLDLLEAAAQKLQLPAQSIPVHLEIDTGMSRQGVRLNGRDREQILSRFHGRSALRLEGVATHFSAPEILDDGETDRQRTQFEAALALVALRGLRPRWVHAGNSTILLRSDQVRRLSAAAADIGAELMLRPGLSLYGYTPRLSEAGQVALPSAGAPAKLMPVLAWKTRVASLRTIEAGESAGYNSTFRAARTTRLALLPMGYGDGLNRLLSNRGSVLVKGRRAPIAGRVSMDQTIVDVTDIEGIEIGDEAVILGCQGEASITAWELAELAGTIPYEVLCNISARVARELVD